MDPLPEASVIDHHRRLIVTLALAGIAFVPPGASAHSDRDEDARHGTTLGGVIGVPSSGSEADVITGATVGWEVTPRFAVEGRGSWFHSGEGVSQFSALLGPRLSVVTSRPVVPFVLAGIGMYRASFESTASAVPEFYRRRIASSAGGAGGSRTFQDVMLAIGGGAELFVTRHLGIRPEATLQIVTTRSDAHLVPAYTVQLAYHFDSHHIVRAPR